MRVLVACEYSGRVREAFRALGHDAWSCDILPAEDGSPYHRQQDVRELLYSGWAELMIAHPPCTRLCNSGVRWLAERNLWAELDDAAAFFRELLDAPIPRIAVENPVPHKYAVERIGRSYDFTTQPYEHGDPYTKRTAFWLKNLPPLVPSSPVAGREPAVHRASPGPDRWRERSRTYPGLAKAMAAQWGTTSSEANVTHTDRE
jgi:hypothetical protein